MKKILASVLVLVCFVFATMVNAGSEKMEEMKPYKGSAEFEKLKGLVGTWAGTYIMGEETGDVSAMYALTSNGSAVVETLFPGTPQEMVSIYHDRKGKLSMMHYCALANQPLMDLSEVQDNKFKFDFSDDNHLDPENEDHMHALMITFVDTDNMIQNWTFYQGGIEAGVNTIALVRVE